MVHVYHRQWLAVASSSRYFVPLPVLIYMYMMAIGTLLQELSAHPQLLYHTVTTLPTRPSCTETSSLYTTSVTLGMS